jgi:hypothetical protein
MRLRTLEEAKAIGYIEINGHLKAPHLLIIYSHMLPFLGRNADTALMSTGTTHYAFGYIWESEMFVPDDFIFNSNIKISFTDKLKTAREVLI